MFINGYTKESAMEKIKKYNTGFPARNSTNGECRYLAVDEDFKENRCVAGCFIPDGHPALEFEGAIGLVMERYPELAGCMPVDPKSMSQFQDRHDRLGYEGDVHFMAREFFSEQEKQTCQT